MLTDSKPGIYINAYCSIENGTVNKNGADVFNDDSADIQSFLLSVYHHFKFDYKRFYKMDNLSKLGWLASEVLLTDSFDHTKYQSHQTGLVLANANASLDSDLKYMTSVADIASPALFVYTLPNIMIGEICIRNSFKGESAFFIQNNFDEVFIYHYVNNFLIKNNLINCICGWVDVLAESYKAVLYLVERDNGGIVFNADNMKEIFNKGLVA